MQVLALRVLATLALACISLLGSPAVHAAPFAVSGPCYLLPPRNEAADPDSFDGAASGFVGDLDGDGVRDRAIHLFPDRPGNDIPGEYHFFVIRGTCGHWVGGFVSMQAERLEVGNTPVQGLRPVIATSHVSGGNEATQYHYTGQGLYPALSKGCGRAGDCKWHPSSDRQPLVRRPNLPQSGQAPVGTDAVTLLFATLKQRGFTSTSPDTLTRGPLVVQRRAGDPDQADIRIDKPTTADCPPNANTSRIGCGHIGRLGEIAEALGGCQPLSSLGEIESIECRDGLILQSSQADRPTRVLLRGGAAPISGPTCDFFPHAGTVQVVPGKSFCIWQQRLTSQTPALSSVAEVGTGCSERVEGPVIIRGCQGVQFYFSKPQGTLTRIEFPAASPASPAKK